MLVNLVRAGHGLHSGIIPGSRNAHAISELDQCAVLAGGPFNQTKFCDNGEPEHTP